MQVAATGRHDAGLDHAYHDPPEWQRRPGGGGGIGGGAEKKDEEHVGGKLSALGGGA